jgi:hypothetical protein
VLIRNQAKETQMKLDVFSCLVTGMQDRSIAQRSSVNPRKFEEIKIFRDDNNRSELQSDVYTLKREPNVRNFNDVIY